jgi:flagellar biosynthesis protein FliQ
VLTAPEEVEATDMSAAQALNIFQDLLYTALLLALPSLAISLIVGLAISVLQTVTSIQEQTLSFVPRIIAVALILIFTFSFSMDTAVSFTLRMLHHATEPGK